MWFQKKPGEEQKAQQSPDDISASDSTSVSHADTAPTTNVSHPPPTPHDATTNNNNNPNNKIAAQLEEIEEELEITKTEFQKEKLAKRKLYSSLLKLAEELKATKEEAATLVEAAEYANRTWYEGGMWRSPHLLPDILRPKDGAVTTLPGSTIIREPVSLTDLFLDLVCVTAFSRVGDAVQAHGSVNGPILAYFAIFWLIWEKEASYSTRFDSTDLSSKIETLLACFAVLFGSLSVSDTFGTVDATRIMMMAAFVAMLHFLLHVRVACMYRGAMFGTEGHHAKKYACLIMGLTFCEFLVWMIGILMVPEEHPRRWIVFLVGLFLSLRVPKSFLANDFHAASSKRGVLFILLLGYTLQSIILVAAPFFDYMSPTTEQYSFLGCVCFLLFCIKLLYVDDTYSIDPKDHALLVNRFANFFFKVGQFSLLVSTTVLWAGLDLLTHSFLAATAALPHNAKVLVSGGFAAVITSILFIKSMHVRRVPNNPSHERMFYTAYSLQLIVYLAIISFSICLCIDRNGHLAFLLVNEVEMLFVLAGAALLLVLVSWLDEAIEMTLYGDDDPREYRVHPFGFWWCFMPETMGDDIMVPHLTTGESASLLSNVGLSGSLYGSGMVMTPSTANILSEMESKDVEIARGQVETEL